MPRIDGLKRRRGRAGTMAIALGGLLLVGVGTTGAGAAAIRSPGNDGTTRFPAAVCESWTMTEDATTDGHRFPSARCASWHTPTGG